VHVENLGGAIGDPQLHNRRLTLAAFPWLFKGGEAAFCRAVAWIDETEPEVATQKDKKVKKEKKDKKK